MAVDNADFSGYATKAGLKCSDGRTITPQAFQHMDGKRVPLVWQHGHGDPNNVLGHAILKALKDGVYAYGFFNTTPWGNQAKALVAHGDIESLSIWANQLVQKQSNVLHGQIKEVSLVLSGANPGAKIENVSIRHGEGDFEELEDEVQIWSGEAIKHELVVEDPTDDDDESDDDDDDEDDESDESVEHADGDTVQSVYDAMTPDQKNVVHFLVGAAVDAWKSGSMAQSDTSDDADDNDEDGLAHQEGNDTVKHNVFDQTDAGKGPADRPRRYLSHDDMRSIIDSVGNYGGSLKRAVGAWAEAHLEHGINDIDTLFPEARNLDATPDWNKRRTEWVAGVLDGCAKTPFSRIKSRQADLTQEEARAKGYIKGSLKKEEWFGLTSRTTGPTTIYKKQKLDRDDVLDITDFDVVAWMKGEMRIMLEEEIARAILVGDGREVDDEDKVKDPAAAASGDGIRSILNDDDLYAPTFNVNLDDASSTYMELIEAILRARRLYKGTGTPAMYTTAAVVSELLLLRDANDRRFFRSLDELAAEMRVSKIVEVEVMEAEEYDDVVAILVNLADYNIGTDKGGEVNLFDDFDIDYNQLKYLIETRLSGALTKILSAQVFRKTGSAVTLVTPAVPSQTDDEVTITNTTGVTYKVSAFDGVVTYNGSQVAVDTTVTASFPIVLADGTSVTVEATPASASYALNNNVEDEWTFTFEA